MDRKDQTWRDKQQEQKRRLAEYEEQTRALRQKLEAQQQHIYEIEIRIQTQKQQSNHRLFHWLLNRQLNRLRKQRQEVTRMIEDIGRLELSQHELKKEIEKPPRVNLRRIRVIYVTPEMVLYLLFAVLIGWIGVYWLLRG